MDLALVKTGLATLLQKNTTAAMDGIFSQVGTGERGHLLCSVPPPPPPPPPQVAGEDEGVREKAIEYVSTSLMSMRHILFIPHPDNEKHLVAHVKKVGSIWK